MEWTLPEKKKLLNILYEVGSGNYDLIHRYMPEKSVLEIQAFCEKYEEMAIEKWKRKRRNHEESSAMEKWLLVFKRIHNTQTGCLLDVVPRALKYIALYEKRTRTSIDLDECYMNLSCLSSGYASKEIDGSTSYFLYESLLKLARSVKTTGNGPSKHFVKYLSTLKAFSNLTESRETTKTTSDSCLINPLSIPKELLAFTH